MKTVLGLVAGAVLAWGCAQPVTPPEQVGAGSTGSTGAETSGGSTSAAGGSGGTVGGAGGSATGSSAGSTSGGTGTSGSACQDLLPPAPGAPVVYQFGPATQFCGDADSDGSGLLYAEHYANVQDFVDVVSPSGVRVASGQGGKYRLEPVAQLSGALALLQGEGGSSLWHIGPDGSGASNAVLASFGQAVMANDPTGGVVIWDEGQNSSYRALRAYDAMGAPRWAVPVSPGPQSRPFWALGVDRQGNALVIWGSSGDGLFAFWVDHAGQRGPEFTLFGAAEFAALNVRRTGAFTLHPRVGGGLFLRVAEGRPEVGRWVRQFDPMATVSTPAPAWLAARSDTYLQMFHGGSAYAVISTASHLESCSQDVEVVSADGTACGTRTFPLASGACDPGRLKVGYDGTLIQPMPDGLESCSTPGVCTCTWRFWPGLFR